MNSQGLYQAVRSRLHFSQVAAWWSRTNGARPSYIATRIVQHGPGDEHLRRFREPPVEHTFPLAGLGDGNSVKVSTAPSFIIIVPWRNPVLMGDALCFWIGPP